MLYARSIDKRHWKGKSPFNIFSVEDTHTQKGFLSVWQVEPQNKLDTALAIVLTRNCISDVYFVEVNDDTLVESLRNFTPNAGSSKWTEKNNTHYDMYIDNFTDYKWLLTYMWDAVQANINFEMFTKKQLKDHLKQCVKTNTISQQTLSAIQNSNDINLKILKDQIQDVLSK